MPDGIVGANDGFFGNFMLGYNPNADTYINNDNINLFIGGASPPTGSNINLHLRALGVGQTGINLYTQGAFIGSSGINLSLDGYRPSGSSNLNLFTVGSTVGYKHKDNNINFYIAGTIPSSNDHLNITVVGPSSGKMDGGINISILNPESKYNRTENLNLYLYNQSLKYIEALNAHVHNTENILSGNMNVSIFGNPVSQTGINMMISGGVPEHKDSYLNMMIQGPKYNATGLNLSIKPSVVMPKGVNINMLGGR